MSTAQARDATHPLSIDLSGAGTFLPATRILAKAQTVYSQLQEEVLPLFEQGKHDQACDSALRITLMENLCCYAPRMHNEVRGAADILPLLDRGMLQEPAAGPALERVLRRGREVPDFMNCLRTGEEMDAGWLGLVATPGTYALRVNSDLISKWVEDAAQAVKAISMRHAQVAGDQPISAEERRELVRIKCSALFDTVLPNLAHYHSSGRGFANFRLALEENARATFLEGSAAYLAQLALAMKTGNI